MELYGSGVGTVRQQGKTVIGRRAVADEHVIHRLAARAVVLIAVV